MPPAGIRKPAAQLLVRRAVLARLLGVSSRQVSGLESDGLIQPARRGKGGRASLFDAATIVPTYIARLSTTTGEGLAPRDRRDLASAQLTELRVAREQGQLVDREQVVRAGRQLVISICAALERLPRAAVNRGAPRTTEPLLRQLVRDIRTAIASPQSWAAIAGDGAPRVAAASALEPHYVTPGELRERLANRKHHYARVQPALRARYQELADAGRGLVEFHTGGWQPWPPTEDELAASNREEQS